MSAAPPAGCGSGELRFAESPEKKDFTLLANDVLDDVGTGVADAVGVGAGGVLLPVKPPNEEHAASVSPAEAAAAASRQLPRSVSLRNALALAARSLLLFTLVMRTPCSERYPRAHLNRPAITGEGEVESDSP